MKMPAEEHSRPKHAKPTMVVTSGISLTWNLIGGSWKIEILWQLRSGHLRFGVLKNRIPPISDRMLSQSLKEMEKAGLVRREVFAEVPPRVLYSLTEEGVELIPILQKMNTWGLQRMVSKARQAIDHQEESTDDHIAWS
jgi:DNA-binding HxlR family transcriptional regulator